MIQAWANDEGNEGEWPESSLEKGTFLYHYIGPPCFPQFPEQFHFLLSYLYPYWLTKSKFVFKLFLPYLKVNKVLRLKTVTGPFPWKITFRIFYCRSLIWKWLDLLRKTILWLKIGPSGHHLIFAFWSSMSVINKRDGLCDQIPRSASEIRGLLKSHIWNDVYCGSRGAPGLRASPKGPNSFVDTQIFPNVGASTVGAPGFATVWE